MRFRHLLLPFIVWMAVPLYAREERDTLKTRMGDRIIIPYDYTVSGEDLTIRFRPALKRLGEENSRRYRKPEQLTVVFFDRNGSFQDAVFSGDLIPEAFMVPAELSYTMSREGYYLLHETPSLSFKFKGDARDVEIAIPTYLAHHVSKGRYKLIARCGSLTVKVQTPSGSHPSAQVVPARETVVSTVEVESDNGDMTRVLDCIANIMDRLPDEDRLPMSESLEGDVRLLREWKYSVTDPNLKAKVNGTLDAYELKKRQLEDAAAAKVRADQRKAEEQQRKAQEELKAREEAEAAQQAEEQEKQKKKTIWMIIGGVILAAGATVGNQFLQSIRNKKNQLNMMEMQQKLTQKAEEEARRQAQKAQAEAMKLVRKAEAEAKKQVQGAPGQVKEILNNTGKKTEGALRQGTGQVAGRVPGRMPGKNKNKKNFTI